ncbi:hypothetical protein ACFX13_016731 [Malus domestica]
MRMVKHPNIVELYEVLASKSKIYFAMDLVRGGELFAKIAKGRLREDVTRVYFQQLISAIDFCHNCDVYHRDLKPENPLLDEDDNLKVTDFRLSAFIEHLKQNGLLHTTCDTQVYVAPEVIGGKKGHFFSEFDLAALASDLNQNERQMMLVDGGSHAGDFLSEESHNVSLDGDLNIQEKSTGIWRRFVHLKCRSSSSQDNRLQVCILLMHHRLTRQITQHTHQIYFRWISSSLQQESGCELRASTMAEKGRGNGRKEEVITREYTINLTKRIAEDYHQPHLTFSVDASSRRLSPPFSDRAQSSRHGHH